MRGGGSGFFFGGFGFGLFGGAGLEGGGVFFVVFAADGPAEVVDPFAEGFAELWDTCGTEQDDDRDKDEDHLAPAEKCEVHELQAPFYRLLLGVCLEEEGYFGIEHGDHFGSDLGSCRTSTKVLFTFTGDPEHSFEVDADEEPDHPYAEEEAVCEEVFSLEDEVSGLGGLVVVEVFGCGIEDIAVGAHEHDGVASVGREGEHAEQRKLFADPEIDIDGEEVEVSRGEEAVDTATHGEIGEVFEAFVEGPFEADAADPARAVVDEADVAVEFEAKGEAFAEAKAGDEEVVVGLFIFDSAAPSVLEFGDVGDGEFDAHVKSGDAEGFGGGVDGVGQRKAKLRGEEAEVALLVVDKFSCFAFVEEVQVDVIGLGPCGGDEPQAQQAPPQQSPGHRANARRRNHTTTRSKRHHTLPNGIQPIHEQVAFCSSTPGTH